MSYTAPMFIIRVIPIARGIAKDELTYWSAKNYEPGSIVKVPLRSREVPALVYRVEPIKRAKQEVRTSAFLLKKIRAQKAKPVLSSAFVRAIEHTAVRHAASVGATLFSYLPAVFLDQDVQKETRPTVRPAFKGYVIPRLYQAPHSDRMQFYKTAVREAFATGGSVFILTPTIREAERVFEALAHGIEEYAYLVTSSVSSATLRTRMQSILKEDHPVLVVMTHGFVALPRHDLATIILEREGSSLYRTRTRPYTDTRTLAHALAAQLGGQLYRGDLPLSIESVYLRDHGEYEEVVSGHHRTTFSSQGHLISMKGDTSTDKRPFRALGTDLVDMLADNAQRGGKAFLYVARRGLSPVTVCRDCGTSVACAECDASVVLHRGAEENYFLCHACGAMRHARERCKDCRSWRLEALGIGTELVEREVRQELPGAPVFVLSHDTAHTHKQAKQVAEEFYAASGGVLIGTELALPYLAREVPVTAIVSLDSLLSIPSWSMYERIASTMTRIREATSAHHFIQTRRPETDVLRMALGGNFSSLYKSEIRMRETLGYPPFTTILKLSVTGTETTVHTHMERAREALKPYELIPYSHALKAPKGKYTLHGYIRIPRGVWPNQELLDRLRTLPPAFNVEVDPESIL